MVLEQGTTVPLLHHRSSCAVLTPTQQRAAPLPTAHSLMARSFCSSSCSYCRTADLLPAPGLHSRRGIHASIGRMPSSS